MICYLELAELALGQKMLNPIVDICVCIIIISIVVLIWESK